MFSTAIIEKLIITSIVLLTLEIKISSILVKVLDNRVFQHARGALTCKTNENDKISLINDIHKDGLEPLYYILRHNIKEEKQALEYEALAIDLLSIVKPNQQPLTNIQGGTHSSEKGLMSLSELKRIYDPTRIKNRFTCCFNHN